MRASAIISMTALLFTSFSAALPTADPMENDTAAIQARVNLPPAAVQLYKSYKDTEAHIPQVAARKDAAFHAWQSEKNPAKKAAAKKEFDAVSQELCKMWTFTANGRASTMQHYNDNDPAHVRELETARRQMSANC